MKSGTMGSVAAGLLLLATPLAWAQDPAKVAPDVYKCTFENEHTRLCEVTVPPGTKIATHSHPPHLVYVLKPGTMRITNDATRAATENDFVAGQALWIPAETHRGENVGTSEIRVLVIEFKDAGKAGAPARD